MVGHRGEGAEVLRMLKGKARRSGVELQPVVDRPRASNRYDVLRRQGEIPDHDVVARIERPLKQTRIPGAVGPRLGYEKDRLAGRDFASDFLDLPDHRVRKHARTRVAKRDRGVENYGAGSGHDRCRQDERPGAAHDRMRNERSLGSEARALHVSA